MFENSMLKAEKEKLLTDDINQGVNLLSVAEMDYMEKIKEFHERLDMVMSLPQFICTKVDSAYELEVEIFHNYS